MIKTIILICSVIGILTLMPTTEVSMTKMENVVIEELPGTCTWKKKDVCVIEGIKSFRNREYVDGPMEEIEKIQGI